MQNDIVPIAADSVLANYPAAEEYLLRAMKASEPQDIVPAFQFVSTSVDSPALKVSNAGYLTARFAKDGGVIPTAEEHGSLYALKRGIAVAISFANWFGETKDLSALLKRNRAGSLSTAEGQRMGAIIKARAWMLTFVTAAFVSQAHQEQDDSAGATEPAATLDAALTSLMSTLNVPDAVSVRSRVGKWARTALAGQIKSATVELGEFFTELSTLALGLDNGEFGIEGLSWKAAKRGGSKAAIVVKKPHEIVGNRVAKAQATKLAKMLASFDFKERKNPFVELGGFLFTVMGDGEPGTGKTSLIQMTCGLLQDYCGVAGYEFAFENFSVDQISDYQGRSAHNARQFVNRILDPSKVSFGSIDDIDQIAGKRDNEKNTSVGQQEVTAVLMNAFDGVDTRVLGNCAFGMFTNYPDKVDDALRQRAAARWLIDGPQTEDDYITILDLMIGKSFAGERHNRISAPSVAVQDLYEAYRTPSDPKLQGLFNTMIERGANFDRLADIGRYLHGIKLMDKRFTGRAIKNIANAVMMRSLDVEMPDAWFSSPEPFLHQPLARKIDMIRELQVPVTGQMVIEEVNRYADGELRFSSKSADAEIDNRVRTLGIETEALKRFHANEVA